jgi:hypothetical protein
MMKQADRKKIKHLHQIHSKEKQTILGYSAWIVLYFWDSVAYEQITEYLSTLIQHHGTITTVSSAHPILLERTPIHLPYIYHHEVNFSDGASVVLFQKYNFSRNLVSLFTSLTWSYLAQCSTVFRKYHRQYEKRIGRPVSLVHPHPKSLWENYTMFLSTVGTTWNRKDTILLGPTWVVLTDVTAVTIAVPGKSHDVGTSVYTHLIHAVHQQRFQKKRYETIGDALGKTLRSCYMNKVVFIDVGLGNYILDSKGVVRFIDGELFQVFPEGVPAHYKALELVLFMETLYLETVRDYYRTVNSLDAETMKKYQRGLLMFFTAFLTELGLQQDELKLAQAMYRDWSTKVSTFYLTFFLSLTRDAQVISSYRIILRDALEDIVDHNISLQSRT